jgi:soluble lytic murein transglycosylase-like protein
MIQLEAETENFAVPVAALISGTAIAIVITALSVSAVRAGDCDDRYPFLCERGVRVVVSFSAERSRAEAPPPSGVSALVDAAAFTAGVPSAVAHAVVRYESGYRTNARSSAGALGLSQIKCATARGIGFAGACRDLFDASINLAWGMKFLRLALDKGGISCAGASLYNLGIYTRARCTGYGRAVMRLVGR